ncbi:hypothetical protein JRO89_XS06G0018900 [Xanthoceras sorbifolium]|uniref:Phospho-N-acetylmuramoyl-pentapeptide-transferase n=1 Tax=Xanthoceras sorbifolium TaxID=99658 RepID=A0ABQ8HWI4_9ROSI|nr:hypothetical protein JRO89_XS06G0018900 [Xanthoceras sorbifolium]
MRSHSSSLNLHRFQFRRCFSSYSTYDFHPRFDIASWRRRPFILYRLQLDGSYARKHGCQLQHSCVQVQAFDEDFGISSFDNWSDNEVTAGYMVSSSDEEDSDGEIVLNPVTDIDLPSVSVSSDESLRVTAHRLAIMGRARKRHRHVAQMKLSFDSNLELCWRLLQDQTWNVYQSWTVNLLDTVLVSCAGYVCVPLLKSLKIRQIIRTGGPARHSRKKRTPTMGGLFMVPVGVAVAKALAGFSSTEVSGASAATLAFAAIGLLDDILCLKKNHSSGLSAWSRLIFEVAVGMWFSYWLHTTNISSPYGMKMLVPLPAPLGLLCLGKYYLLLTSFTFVSMGNGVNLTDGLDGLAGGTAALAFIGMSIAVLPICSDLSVFGVSMAGACVGFLSHNRYKASVFMGDTGSLALGGALAAMAACTGMFFPLFVSSGIFVVEASSVMMQVFYFKTTKRLQGAGRRLFRMAPFHHHLELCGIKEPIIVAGAYVISAVLALFAGYVGLVSA